MRFLIFVLSAVSLQARAIPQSTPQNLYERGEHYWSLSMQAYNELQKTAPNSAYALSLIGQEKARKGQYSAALEVLNEAARQMPNFRGIHSAIADVYVALGEPAQASAAETAEQNLGRPDCYVEKLACDFSARRFEDVVSAAKLEKSPESLYWVARAYRELALQTFADLNNLPESAELHKIKALLLREERKYSESISEWRAALNLSPGDHNLQRELATTLFLSEDYRGILPELQQLLTANPDSANINFFVGESLLETQQTQEAVRYLETALRLDPKLLPAHVALGTCYVRLDEARKAIPHLRMGLELDKSGRLYYLLARAYKQTGQPELAKAMMDKFQQLQRASEGSPPR